ncbi:MAG: NAD(P)-dependent glycerol-3-phosphate dehydrogenase [Kordiimonadaceae bacterium]|nr:NAD(P)-dependent glycerol-3-phosphate dehydrogenase [Kordiimonadaceae bacterium]MBO6568146.1 NAD(P)-dependent glycerol-3-phosphate dehydrogenase [Kordiimonadaceae bacterium]MBO6964124.1 NAD(P)-dependent glycerol-3-phosphate dehydrogenase [Kordiimonadaceae bacterium]
MEKIGVLGGGAWGTALAAAANQAGRDTVLWAREPEVVSAVNETHENSHFLPGVALDSGLTATGDLADFADRDAILMVAPAQYTRVMAAELIKHIGPKVPLVICSKGIEVLTGKLLSDAIGEVAPGHPVCVLSGPTFASEVARGLPCAVTLAAEDEDLGSALMQALGLPTFRPYFSTDIIGAQIGGAVKNVLAIATGVAAGLGTGENARAAVITRGLAEIVRFGALYGARRETLMGLSGLGDLILTCSSTQSRNMSLGKAIGEGMSFEEIMAERTSVAEGAHTVDIVHKIAQDKGLDMPITSAVYRILKKGEDARDVMDDLLNRPFTDETQ